MIPPDRIACAGEIWRTGQKGHPFRIAQAVSIRVEHALIARMWSRFLIAPWPALLLLMALSACESEADRALRSSPDFKAGYSDGCASAGSQGADPRQTGRIRDENAYRTNQTYHAGWGTGFNACRSYQGSPNGPSFPGQGPLPDAGPRPF